MVDAQDWPICDRYAKKGNPERMVQSPAYELGEVSPGFLGS